MSVAPKESDRADDLPDSIAPSPEKKRRKKKDPLIGRTINGRFTILEVIARGGMGKVYKAEQAPLGRLCAVKVLNPKYDGDEDPEFQKRFFLEASTAAKLSHANTVTIFDYGRDDDIYYIAMELVRGRTLYRLLRDDGPLEEYRVAHIMRQVGRSLREAHSLGVIHRDMKPANVVLLDAAEEDEMDTVKVLDFGLVKHVEQGEGEDLTQQGLFMGSPKYMAPEQILGNPVSPCTDIYSLGVVAYELMTGSVPFDRGASVKTLMAHVNEPPPAMHKINPSVAITPAMHRIIMCCLEKEPEARFASIDDLLRELTYVEGGGSLTDSLLSAPRVRPPPSTSGAHRRVQDPTSVAPGAVVEDSNAQTRPISTRGSGFPAIPGALAVPSSPPSMTPSATPTASSYDDLDLQPRRSSGAMRIGIAAVVVAAIGGVAFAVTSTGDSSPDPAEQATPGETPSETNPVVTPQTSTAATPPTTADGKATVRTVRVTSKPSGASVKENGKVLCGATPCDVTWRDAGAGASHSLEFSKRGFVTTTVEVAGDVNELNAELKIARRGVVRPRTPRPKAAPKAKPAPAPAPQPKKGKGLSGYKDSPY